MLVLVSWGHLLMLSHGFFFVKKVPVFHDRKRVLVSHHNTKWSSKCFLLIK
jgi:hypothetical protein